MKLALISMLLGAVAAHTAAHAGAHDDPHTGTAVEFQTSDRCVACHNGMTNSAGDQYSIGTDWSTSLMANSTRDPYWVASTRRETLEHAPAQAAIETECAACHMPIGHTLARLQNRPSEIFAHLPLKSDGPQALADGVTCSVCHQIIPQGLGTAETFNGNFHVAPAQDGQHPEYGPYDIDVGLQRVMRSSTAGYQPQRGDQIRAAELCASCHTLTTEARDASGAVVGSLPEQMPYQEWLRSDFRSTRTCQSCHMPAVAEAMPVARILAAPRPGAARHQFLGANFAMQKILARHHDELAVAADPQLMYEAADRTIRYLQDSAARVSLSAPQLHGRRLEATVSVQNLGGHKLPTAYPARRAWLHVVVRDAQQRIVFESGAPQADGSIAGNDNDVDPTRYEPHWREIHDPGQVQIYEAILGDNDNRVTTGLLAAARYLKDNRLLPSGFDKTGAPAEVAVHGDAVADPAFTDRGHSVLYAVDIGDLAGTFEVTAELWFQPIGYRWAHNLTQFPSAEGASFAGYYESLGAAGAIMLAKASASTIR